MTVKRTYIFIFSAIVLSALSILIIFLSRTSLPDYNKTIGKQLLPNLYEFDIKEIKIIKPGGRTINLIKDGDRQWSVGNYFRYPAELEKVNTLIQELSSLRAVQIVNLEGSMMKTLSLNPPSEKDKETGTEIRILGADGQTIYSIIAGQKRIDTFGSKKLTKGRYVSLADSKIPILCEENLDEIQYSAKDFLSSDFPVIKDIKKISLSKSSVTLWTIFKKDQNQEFELFDRKKEDPNINIDNVYSVISSLESLKFDSVADPETKADSTGLDRPYIIKVETFNGENFTIEIGKQFSSYYYVKVKSLSFPQGEKWIYLIDNSRITPLLQSLKDLSENKKGFQNPIYSRPIG